MEQVCDPKNVIRAYRRVRANKGKPGVDGMTVHELMDWLRINQAALTASLLDGTYQPYPVRGAQIRKSGGGQRQLGIPVVRLRVGVPLRVVFAVCYRIDTLDLFFHSSIPGLPGPYLRFAFSLSTDGARLGVRWVTTPFLKDSFILYTMPVYPGAQHIPRNKREFRRRLLVL
jgi:RNA-directed DNA polymerase